MTPKDLSVVKQLRSQDGYKTFPAFSSVEGEASSLLLPISESLLSSSTMQPENILVS